MKTYIKFGLFLFLGIVVLALPRPIRASRLDVERTLFLPDGTGQYLCPGQITQRYPGHCPPFSPGARQTRLDFLRSSLPNPLPELAVQELEMPEEGMTSYTFAYVRPLPAPTYRHPEEAMAGMPPLREFLAGDNWVSVMGEVEYEGELWYQINPGEFVRAGHLSFTSPSRFRGVFPTEQPRYPFAWINRDVRPSFSPAGAERSDMLLRRYEMITIYAQEHIGNQMWYLIGQDQWVEQSYTARVTVSPIPEGVGPDEKWIEVNTYEQTLAAYEGERMVFATLVSTGRRETWTPNGLNRMWGKLPTTPMINRSVGPGSPAYYYLEDVEWTQYFIGAYAIHAAYWHNSFGFTRSHGCVNMSILDAKWLFEWTEPHVPAGARIVQSSESQPGTWVWVHMTSPFPEDGAER